MRIKLGLLAMAAASLFASGCQFYFGDHHGDDDDQCAYPATDTGVAIPVQQARNPYTGECVTSGGGGGGGGGCVGIAHPDSSSTAPGAGDAIWFDTRWPVCENQCNVLGEAQCVAADGCRAIYVAGADGSPAFNACWATTSDGPIRGGNCGAIVDAFQCAQHDDCAAFHDSQSACGPNEDCAGIRPGGFISCLPEPGVVTGVCRVDTDCQMGERCDTTDYCEPDPSCLPGEACPPVCWGKCVPTDPPPPPPPPPPASCSGLDEDTCIDMADGCIDTGTSPSCGMLKCEPIYAGSNCDCTPAGCTCQSWTYQSCQSL
jgi:hypothetical protein